MDDPKPPKNAEELLRRYAAGERSFSGTFFPDADANLEGANLEGVNLLDAHLFRANLKGANLQGANLQRAHLGHANLEGANLDGASLLYARFDGANLQGANLQGANLRAARGTDANLQGAHAAHANLQGADLEGTSLKNVTFDGANLQDANLKGAVLEGASFLGTFLMRTKLKGALFEGTIIGETLFVDVDLSSFCGAGSAIKHYFPSVVDHTCILRSVHAPRLKEFLARTGMPGVFVEYMTDSAMSLKSEVFKMLRSTFISYGSPDEPFARKLYEVLHGNGVTTFFFPEHAVPGEKLHDVMRRVNDFDRTVLVCSKNSLDRKGVANEVEQIIARETRDGGASYLIPITLDDYVFGGWKPPKPGTAQEVRDRVVADFRGADTDPAKFQTALQRLIGALKK